MDGFTRSRFGPLFEVAGQPMTLPANSDMGEYPVKFSHTSGSHARSVDTKFQEIRKDAARARQTLVR